MRLAGADRPIQDQGIGEKARRFDHAQRGRMRQTITRPNNKVFQPPPTPYSLGSLGRTRWACRFAGHWQWRGVFFGNRAATSGYLFDVSDPAGLIELRVD